MIAVSAANDEQLRMMGRVPESFDTVIGRLIEEHNSNSNAQKSIAVGAAKVTK